MLKFDIEKEDMLKYLSSFEKSGSEFNQSHHSRKKNLEKVSCLIS